MGARFIIGDVFEVLADIPDGSVDLVLTSPPFLALRSYLPADHPDKGKEIGSEPTPAAFLDTLLDLTVEWRRVLAPHGSIAIELGDTYSGSGGAGGDYAEGGLRDGQGKFDGAAARGRNGRASMVDAAPGGHHMGGAGWPLAKSLCGIPTLFAWSLAYGRNLLNPAHEIEPWRVRNLVAWCRPNPPVGALCVDDQTEALTPDGWKRHDALDDGDLIAAYDPRTDSCRFLPAKFVRWDREGEPMVAIDKKATSQVLTEDHRCWTRTRKSAPHVRLARDLTNECETLLCAPFDDVPGNAPVTTERAALLGWFVAEGTPHHRQARIVQSLTANPHKVAAIRELLARDGADFRETVYRHPKGSDVVTFHVKGELAEWLNMHHKRLPMVYATTWPEAQARALFDALVDGDGHRRKNAEGVLFHQQDEAIADAVQVLATRLGYRATKSWQPSMRIWQITMGKRSRWTALRKWEGTGIRRETYTGIVWCPMVETSFWLARRDGKTFITGNSDKFRPGTSYMTIATVAKDRYFDLDAVREASQDTRPRNTNGPKNAAADSTDVLGHYDTRTTNPAGAPPLDWWEIPTQPYAGAHYATFPSALCVRPIKAMVPHRVCTECGQPSRRITGEPEYLPSATNRGGILKRDGERSAEGVNQWVGEGGAAASVVRSVETLGWSDCGHDAWRNGVVLDCFGGSGTTGQVATGHGRNAVLIDLDERNADLAIERIGPMLCEVSRHGDGTPLPEWLASPRTLGGARECA